MAFTSGSDLKKRNNRSALKSTAEDYSHSLDCGIAGKTRLGNGSNRFQS
jgi:hypothetical protein